MQPLRIALLFYISGYVGIREIFSNFVIINYCIMDPIDKFLTPDLPLSHKYYWRNRMSRHHIDRMLRLAPFDQLEGDVNGVPDTRYLMYRVDELVAPDGARRYEFLIEYDIYNPSQGIYFGCKSVTIPGHRHKKEILNANEDWSRVKSHILRRLNNIFIDKDFSYRFNAADNANDNTYWPFWISLYEDEDPREVATRALSVIAGAYRQLEAGELPEISEKENSGEKSNEVRTAFTEEAYSRLRRSIESSVKAVSYLGNGVSANEPLSQQAWRLFEEFLVKGVEVGFLHKVSYYERAWMLDKEYSDVDFKCMMTLVFQQISNILGTDTIRISWTNLLGVFLQPDETPFKQQVKTLSVKAPTRRYWSSLLCEVF